MCAFCAALPHPASRDTPRFLAGRNVATPARRVSPFGGFARRHALIVRPPSFAFFVSAVFLADWRIGGIRCLGGDNYNN